MVLIGVNFPVIPHTMRSLHPPEADLAAFGTESGFSSAELIAGLTVPAVAGPSHKRRSWPGWARLHHRAFRQAASFIQRLMGSLTLRLWAPLLAFSQLGAGSSALCLDPLQLPEGAVLMVLSLP
jgi:hypothetical protein